MKIGIDHHGVLDNNPVFKEMGKLFVAAGHEVHIITGAQFNNVVQKKFRKMGVEKGVHFTHYFAITDYLLQHGEKVTWKNNNPSFDRKRWDVVKSIYCRENTIDLHFDDSEAYAKFFDTPICIKK